MASDDTNQGESSGDSSRRLGATIVTRISGDERAQLLELAEHNDRTLSREVRRAIRWYLAVTRSGDAALRERPGPR